MTEEKDGPVHYQVSVTGRQAAGFFLLLLVALGLAFFFGMKTGAAAKRGPDPLTRIADGSDIAVPTVVAERDGRRPEKTAPESKEPPIGFPPETPTPEPKPTPAPEPTPVKAGKPQPTQAPAAEPAEEPAAKATPRPTAKPAEKSGPLYVQVFVTKSAEKADSIAKKMQKDGFTADVSLVPGKTDLFRVRSGPYPDRAKAEAAAKKIAKHEQLETRVVP